MTYTTTLYDTDFYTWTAQTVHLLKERRFSELDLENLIEEIEDLGRSEYRALGSRLEVVLMHLLKVRYQPEMHTKSWDLTLQEQRLRIQRLLRDNPGLKPKLPQAWEDAWEPALIQAQRETGLEATAFPQENPFTLDEAIAAHQESATHE
jgi:Domain of unknown function DUF29